MIAHTPTLTTEDTDTVSLVDHDGTIVLMLQLNNLWQLGEVTLHREHAVDHNQLDSLLWQLREHTLQIFHVIVLVMQLLGKRKTTTVHN